MSNLTDLLPAGAGGKQVSFVASGTIGNGVTVALNSDGTVEAVGVSSEGVGSASSFSAGRVIYLSSAFDSLNNKIVLAYQDNANSSYGTAIVGTISGNSISFGSSTVFSSSSTTFTSCVFDSSSGKIVIQYRDDGNSFYGKAIVGTVSGTSISFGSSVIYKSARVNSPFMSFDSSSNKVVIGYSDDVNADYGTAVVGTVSGSSISFGAASVFESAEITGTTCSYDLLNDKTIISYRDRGNSDYGTAVVGTVSGTSISFGTPTVFASANTYNLSASYIKDTSKTVISYTDGGNSAYGTAIVATVSGTSISFGSEVVFESSSTSNVSTVFDSNANRLVTSYKDGSGYGTVISGLVDGTSISFDSAITFYAGTIQASASAFSSDANKVAISYAVGFTSGEAVVYNSESSNSTSFIGISDAAISDTASGSVTIKGGISTNVTGLTPNATYYVQTDGSLSTTASDVLAGKALSSTSINLDYTT
jgi:hypothetical protein